MQILDIPLDYNAAYIPALNGILGLREARESDMAAINFHRPAQSPEHAMEDLFVGVFPVVDNTISQDFQYLGYLLPDIAATNPGKPWTVDHNVYEADKPLGYCFDGALFELDPSEVPPEQLSDPDFEQINRMIVQREGYRVVTLAIAFQKYVDEEKTEISPVWDAIHFGRLKGISIHGRVRNRRLICPLNGLTFDDPENPFYPPWMIHYIDPEFAHLVSPYEEYHGRFLGVETSNVVSPCFRRMTVPIAGNESGVMPRAIPAMMA